LLEFVVRVLAETAAFEDGLGEGVEHRHVLRLAELARADPGVQPDPAFFELGALEVDPHLIGKNQLRDTEVLDLLRAGDGAGFPEIRVAEGDDGARRGSLDGRAARILEKRR
jgi:hypothetical protein